MEVDGKEEGYCSELSSTICDLGERANAASGNLENAICRYPEGLKEECLHVIIDMQPCLKGLLATPKGG